MARLTARQVARRTARSADCRPVGRRWAVEWPARLGRFGRVRSARAAAPGRGGYGADTGSATVWLLALAMLGTTVFAATVAVGTVVAARHRAESAADLAALAAADRLLLDPDGGCARAVGIAAAQGAALVSCAVDRSADAVEVVAEVPVGGLPRRLPVGPARARSRAGPVRAPATAAEDGLGEALGGPSGPGTPGGTPSAAPTAPGPLPAPGAPTAPGGAVAS
ncbi:Rv3654c family TadE-like protein [Kitasatospora sp. NPDC059146]|uniref:Rv3654c family TadE-like protein n=1 Tax=Kitasatospora sp. NPDC059146 TaxID=3346741 RepID=UPI0036B2535F